VHGIAVPNVRKLFIRKQKEEVSEELIMPKKKLEVTVSGSTLEGAIKKLYEISSDSKLVAKDVHIHAVLWEEERYSEEDRACTQLQML
jgi:hypothetical protein